LALQGEFASMPQTVSGSAKTKLKMAFMAWVGGAMKPRRDSYSVSGALNDVADNM
jgi:hypothetical protein